jgi:transposase
VWHGFGPDWDGKEVISMSSRFSHLVDPMLEDPEDPFQQYDSRPEPLADRLYLPCGIDPHEHVCGVAFLHPLPQSQEILEARVIHNHDWEDFAWLMATGQRLARPFQAQPIYVFEATGPFWQPYRHALHQAGLATATVCGRQTKHARATQTRKTKTDLQDAANIAHVFKNGDSHASRIPPEPMASLREYSRLHLFFVEQSVAIQNRMYGLRYQIHPGFDDLISDPGITTALTLMQAELIQPQNILAYDFQDLTALIQRASRGKLGTPLAQALVQSAQTTFRFDYAAEALSFNLHLLAEAHLHIHRNLLPCLRQRIEDLLTQVPFEHHLDELPMFGPIVMSSFLGELGWPGWFHSVDSVVAWFGLEPSVSESAAKTTGRSHLTKRGSVYGRRTLWLAARNWSQYTAEGHALLRKEMQQHHLAYDGAVCALAARLARIAFAMLRDGSHFNPKALNL